MWNRDEQDSQFSQMIEARLSRRRFLAGTAAVGAGAFLSLNPITKAFAADKKSALLNLTLFRLLQKMRLLCQKAIKQHLCYLGVTQYLLMRQNSIRAVSKTQKLNYASSVTILTV